MTAPLIRTIAVGLTCLAVCLFPLARAAHAEGVAVEQATAQQKQAAQEKYDAAMAAFQAKRYDEALAGFRESYAVVASPNSRLMVANVLQAQGDVVAAYWEAQATVEIAEASAAHDDRYAPAADSARKALARLRALVGLVTVQVIRVATSKGDERLTVAGKQIERNDWGKTLAVAPGQCEVVLTGEGGSAHKEIAVSAGATIEITIGPLVAGSAAEGSDDEEEGDEPGSRQPTGAAAAKATQLYVAGGVIGTLGVAGGVLFAVFGSLAKSNYDDLIDQCPNDRCSADLEGQADSTRTQQVVANVSLVAGAVGLAAGVGLLVAGSVVAGSSEEPEPAVGVSLGPGTVWVSGRF